MIEIRLVWSGDTTAPYGRPPFTGMWMPATFVNRRTLNILKVAIEAIFGTGSCWIEKRRIPPFAPAGD